MGERGDVSGDGLNPRIAVERGYLDLLCVDAEDGAAAAEGTQALASHLEPPAGGAAEVENGGARADNLVLVLYLKELEGRPSYIP